MDPCGSLLPGEIFSSRGNPGADPDPDPDPAAGSVPVWCCRIHRDGSAGSVPACSGVRVSRPAPLSAVTAGLAAANSNFK